MLIGRLFYWAYLYCTSFSAGPTCDWAPIPHYINNHLSWISLVNQLPKETRKKVRAVVVTGWSRYDHFATLCELLPSALPCLAMCLATFKEGYFDDEIHKKVSQNLGYLRPIQLEYKPFMQLDDNCGNFPGSLQSLCITGAQVGNFEGGGPIREKGHTRTFF